MIRLERRGRTTLGLRVGAPFGGLVVALVIVGVLLLASGIDPLSTYNAMVKAAVTSSGALSATLLNATPLILTGLCATVAFRLEVYNIGGEGQLYIGAMAATAAALLVHGQPGFVQIAAMLLAGGLAGALWAALPGVLRAYLHTNEILTSLMLNYVAGLLITYLIFNSDSYWRDTTSAAGKVYPTGKTIPGPAFWPNLHLGGVEVPFGIVVGVVAAIGCALCLRRMTVGFRIRVAAGSPAAARYGGINTRRLVLGVMLVSGLLAGLGGAAEVGTASHLLDPTSLQQAQYGYAGIVVAALGAFDPLAVVLSGLFLGAIASAGTQLAGVAFPEGLVGAIEGIVLFCVVSAALLVAYRVRWRSAPGARTPDPVEAEPAGRYGRPPVAAAAGRGDDGVLLPGAGPEA